MTGRGNGEHGGVAAPSGLPVGDLLTSEPVTADLPTPRRVLAVGAHPDDIEFGCGATLAKWVAGGAELHYVVLTDGSKGAWDAGADLAALVSARVGECRAAAAVTDGIDGGSPLPPERVFFMQRVDGELVNGADERRALAEIIRQVKPTVVLGHDPWRRYRLHPDHRVAGHITVDALVAARDHHFFPELGLAPHRPRSLLLWEADAPNHVEDARGFEQTKIDALLCHHSQLESTMGFDDLQGEGATLHGSPAAVAEFSAKVRRQLAQHGSICDLPSAEAFRLITDL
ncbi:MAG TPA: PIG-L deacetylase family protein [Acidimicrobiales bacterium]|nr:PIG-L deacetylase family protein [Acidimicrobiales bacterium]